MSTTTAPLPLFDALEHITKQKAPTYLTSKQRQEFIFSINFLKSYIGSLGTFNSYRREIERLLHWCMLISHKPLNHIKREDIENYIRFCQKPTTSWIGIKKAPRFLIQNGRRKPNNEWRPYVATISKNAFRQGQKPSVEQFRLSHGALKQLFAILGTFFNYLLQEEYIKSNPVALIRQKSKFVRKIQGQNCIRRLSELQWQYVIQTAQNLAAQQPAKHERTLFVISILYSMYLRISELAASVRWVPSMNHFARDSDGNWWFTTVGKGNKQRQIAVSDAMLVALKRWRKHLNLPSLPTPADTSSLLSKTKGQGPITNTNPIRKIVQHCFDKTKEELIANGLTEEAATLAEATVHWLRHTGISDDVKYRPREHVRDDAGHSSSATTDKYIDIELKERHRSAKNKPI